MLSIENFKNARWGELYAFFAQGNPPLGLQLLLLNTIFLGFMIYRRTNAKYNMRRSSVLLVQGILIAANLVLMFQKDAFNAAMTVKHMI